MGECGLLAALGNVEEFHLSIVTARGQPLAIGRKRDGNDEIRVFGAEIRERCQLVTAAARTQVAPFPTTQIGGDSRRGVGAGRR